MLGVQVFPMDDALVVEDAVTKHADGFQIRLPVLALVQALGQMGKHGLEGSGQERCFLFVMVLEKADPEAKLEFGHDAGGGHRFTGFRDLDFCLGHFLRRPWGERETKGIVPIDPSHQGGSMTVDGVAERDFAKLERRIEALAQRHIEQITGESRALIWSNSPVRDRIGSESFRGKSLLDLLEENRIHDAKLQELCGKFELTCLHSASTLPVLTPELPLPPFATVTGAGVSFCPDSERIAESFQVGFDGGFEFGGFRELIG